MAVAGTGLLVKTSVICTFEQGRAPGSGKDAERFMIERPHVDTILFRFAFIGVPLRDPHVGMMKTSKMVRFLHKNGGRLLLGAAFACSALGWSTVQKQAALPIAMFVLPLAILMKALI
ncbi:unnamed protein product [Symbiodinium natans]|uniref:Uncharacterized protein n=1 Tax=Symbiodinium natans TaxID=878477 RepID=A0A812TP07_9DINO|nr:unnamed protein product [Symbiodinium natans]